MTALMAIFATFEQVGAGLAYALENAMKRGWLIMAATKAGDAWTMAVPGIIKAQIAAACRSAAPRPAALLPDRFPG